MLLTRDILFPIFLPGIYAGHKARDHVISDPRHEIFASDLVNLSQLGERKRDGVSLEISLNLQLGYISSFTAPPPCPTSLHCQVLNIRFPTKRNFRGLENQVFFEREFRKEERKRMSRNRDGQNFSGQKRESIVIPINVIRIYFKRIYVINLM